MKSLIESIVGRTITEVTFRDLDGDNPCMIFTLDDGRIIEIGLTSDDIDLYAIEKKEER